MPRMRAIAFVGALAASAVLGACGGADPGDEERAEPAPLSGTIDVQLTDGEIQPANVTIEKPGEVTFKVRNTGRKMHALRVDGPPPVIMVETMNLRRRQSDTITTTLSRPGKYRWYCPYHRKQGMSGTITVPKP
jgi:plastocyanin